MEPWGHVEVSCLSWTPSPSSLQLPGSRGLSKGLSFFPFSGQKIQGKELFRLHPRGERGWWSCQSKTPQNKSVWGRNEMFNLFHFLFLEESHPFANFGSK